MLPSVLKLSPFFSRILHCSVEEDGHVLCVLVNLVAVVKFVKKRGQHRGALGRSELSGLECARRFRLRTLREQHARVPALAHHLLDRGERGRHRVPRVCRGGKVDRNGDRTRHFVEVHRGKADNGYELVILVLAVVERVGFDERRGRLEAFLLAKL